MCRSHGWCILSLNALGSKAPWLGVGHGGAEASLVITPISGGYIISTPFTLVANVNSIQCVS